ncbi:16S rRNA (cytidine(1402)-2'-O)-methyltransferase [Mycoplasmopsis opalescens]|uniref:16S rRNA (cytidine(1402)-2'-O)-methyltransferase n=1 Tax=Mycoplasmopsis opalescens TaxID=114886 RepID=UPI0004A6B1F4|nr:16S rRNA (cytidine(1402)-2'-O)-methyltransferase [Mycoplasmopsis opalescens]
MSKIFIVGTPIGNLKDITLRALETLKSVDFIACEDTRTSRKLLKHYDINKPLFAYHKMNEKASATALLDKIKDNEKTLALISDAGMPLISDPGFELIKQAREMNLEVAMIPGVSASITALAWSGLSSTFTFMGFPNEKSSQRQKALLNHNFDDAYIYFVAPHKLINFLKDIAATFNDEATIFLAKELTKMFEKHYYGTASNLIDFFKDQIIKGEFTLVLKRNKLKHEKVNKYAKFSKIKVQ